METDNLQNADGEQIENKPSLEKTNEPANENVEKTLEKNQEVKESQHSNDSEDYKHEEPIEEEVEEAEIETIPIKDYDELSIDILIGEAKTLLSNYPAIKLRTHFSQIRDAVKKQLDEEEEVQKKSFIEGGGNAIDFYYDNPYKNKFYAVYNDYKKQLDAVYKEREKQQKANLEERSKIIEDLKALYLDPNNNSSNIFTQFRQIKTRWHNAGPIPSANANNIFKTYFHHLDNFYTYLNMNNELRELDYAHNLEVRYSIIKRAEALVQEPNVQKALNELQYLHRLWKEEAVPVAEELREPTWETFKNLTNKIHERKNELNEQVKVEQQENLAKKEALIEQINSLVKDSDKNAHSVWQRKIKEFNQLREQFLAVGRIPREKNNEMWDAFKTATRNFNHKKNNFYKELKIEQQANLEKKMALLAIAKQERESENWKESVQVIKRIQAEWKTIGHVPRKNSDKIWKEFKEACNYFFERFKNKDQKNNQIFEDNLKKKEAILEELKSVEIPENQEKALDLINSFNIKWNRTGKVPSQKMDINNDYNKTINEIMDGLNLSKNEIQDYKMNSLVNQIKSDPNGRILDDEIRSTRRHIDELEKEIVQLETNISFFSNADENSPLLQNVYSQIKDKRNRLTDFEIRLRKLYSIDLEEELKTNESVADDSEE